MEGVERLFWYCWSYKPSQIIICCNFSQRNSLVLIVTTRIERIKQAQQVYHPDKIPDLLLSKLHCNLGLIQWLLKFYQDWFLVLAQENIGLSNLMKAVTDFFLSI